MSAITFDRLAYVEALKLGGVPEPQARAHAVALDDALRDTVATKGDVKAEITAVRHDMEVLKRDLTIRMGGMIMALGTVLVAIKYFE